ncbi:uncharacterized protein DS421_8g240000 [Arachis hypogaea]|nr:uncharacterized protein DS421_8g240000 [Arachis hypogaea]
MNNDSDEEFEATYEADDEDDDGGSLDLDAMHAPKFSEYANIGVADSEDEKFRIGIEYGSRKSSIVAIRALTVVDNDSTCNTQ